MQQKDISNYISCKWSTELCAINILKLVNDMQRETYIPLLYSRGHQKKEFCVIWKSTYSGIHIVISPIWCTFITIRIIDIDRNIIHWNPKVHKLPCSVCSPHPDRYDYIYLACTPNKINTLFARVINCNCIQLHTPNRRFHLCYELVCCLGRWIENKHNTQLVKLECLII